MGAVTAPDSPGGQDRTSLAADRQSSTGSHYLEPTCTYRGHAPAPQVQVGDKVRLCTAPRVWTVRDLDDGRATLTVRSEWLGDLVVDVGHLDVADGAD